MRFVCRYALVACPKSPQSGVYLWIQVPQGRNCSAAGDARTIYALEREYAQRPLSWLELRPVRGTKTSQGKPVREFYFSGRAAVHFDAEPPRGEL